MPTKKRKKEEKKTVDDCTTVASIWTSQVMMIARLKQKSMNKQILEVQIRTGTLIKKIITNTL